MLIVAIAITAWIAILALAVALAAAAARGDEVLADGDPRARTELAPGIVVLEGALLPAPCGAPAGKAGSLRAALTSRA
jgi:hypothetical protein